MTSEQTSIAPLSSVDPRAKLLVTLVAIIALTFADLAHLGATALLVVALAGTLIGLVLAHLLGVSAPKAVLQSALVLPFVIGIAVFAPLAQLSSWSLDAIGEAYALHWPLIFDILIKSFGATFLVVLVMRSMSIETFIHTLTRLKVPAIFIMLFTFLYRFTDLFREQIRIMRDAARSRAPYLHGWRLLAFYGRMSGNLFIRAYERGEQIHDAMLSRGYDGTLPQADKGGQEGRTLLSRK
ncbi:MAG: energy-coupling factor transporter transmembrane protein EcfT [Coriobacteriia bacterium]|nr:energy-coupling factor transporter transmembrane protein EcfT [Coriobacteriia bacterium]